LAVVDTVQDEPLTVRVDMMPLAEKLPSGWQTQMPSPESSDWLQHTFWPLPPPLLLLLHAAMSAPITTTHAEVINFMILAPFRSVQRLTAARPWLDGSLASRIHQAETPALHPLC
jgi:hypothetical protein